MYPSPFIYMLNYPVINYPVTYSLPERESSSKHAKNCVDLIKIENSSYHQELVPHPMPEHVDELSLVRINPVTFSNSY